MREVMKDLGMVKMYLNKYKLGYLNFSFTIFDISLIGLIISGFFYTIKRFTQFIY